MLLHEFSLLGDGSCRRNPRQTGSSFSWSEPIPMMAIAASMVATGSSHAPQTMQTARQLLEA
jgi:hypothetical protein